MATSTLPIFLLLLSLFLVALPVYARPCKTLFFYATTTSYNPADAASSNAYPGFLNPNPNPNDNFIPLEKFEKFHSYSPKFLTFFLTTAKTHEGTYPRVAYVSLRRTPFHLYYSSGRAEKFVSGGDENESEEKRSDDSVMPLGIYSSVSTSSIRDRTKDIMSVVGALLFGVGCGALTAATMFLIWSLFSPHRFEFEDSEDDADDDDDDEKSHKQVAYVTFPDDDVDLIKKGLAAQKNGYVAIPNDDVNLKKEVP